MLADGLHEGGVAISILAVELFGQRETQVKDDVHMQLISPTDSHQFNNKRSDLSAC